MKNENSSIKKEIKHLTESNKRLSRTRKAESQNYVISASITRYTLCAPCF